MIKSASCQIWNFTQLKKLKEKLNFTNQKMKIIITILLKNGKTISRALNYVQTINKICDLTWNIEAIIVQNSTCMSDIYIFT